MSITVSVFGMMQIGKEEESFKIQSGVFLLPNTNYQLLNTSY